RDGEMVLRAGRCLEPIPTRAAKDVRGSALRLLTARDPAGAVEVLLAYLPHGQDEWLEEQIVTALITLGVRDGQPHPALVKAAEDKLPSRRLAAAVCLVRADGAKHRAAARRLLDDPDARVRFVTAQALVAAQDKAGIPALLALLGDGPAELAWRA